MAQSKVKRIYAFDFLRIISACAVVMIHVSVDFIKEYDNSTVEFLWGNIFSAVSRFAVPVFLMISGALMLDEDKNLSTKKIMKSTLSILALTFSWSFIYALGYDVIKPILFGEPISLSGVADTFFNGHYHMWFLYVLIGLYLITPILRFFIKKENATLIRNYLIFSVIICFVLSFMNVVLNRTIKQQDVLSDFVSNFSIGYIYEYIVYYIMGWYITKVKINKPTRSFIYAGSVVGLIGTIIGTHLHFGQGFDEYFTSNNSPNVFVYSLAVFIFVYNLFERKNITMGPFWLKVSQLTFGVYLVHCIFLFALKMICEDIDSALIEILVVFAGGTLLSFVTVFIMSKIPLVKKLIRA